MSAKSKDIPPGDSIKRVSRKPSIVLTGPLRRDSPQTSRSSGPYSRSRATSPPPERPTRKRAASVDTEIANHRIQDLAINSSPQSGTVRERVCLCQPDPKIPRPRNAFILYRQHYQAQIVAQHPGLANPEISKILGEQWKGEPPKVKNDWRRLAEQEKERHRLQYPDYRYQPRRLAKSNARHITSTSPDGPAHCPKCNGRYISTPSTPITPSPLSLESRASGRSPRSTLPSAALPYDRPHLSSFVVSMPRAVPTDQSMHRRPGILQNRPVVQAGTLRDDDMERMISPSPEQKRRRFVEGPGVYPIPSPYGAPQRISRPPISAVGYKDERRGTLSGLSTPKYHLNGSMMEPPPRPIPAMHQYSPTFDESLRLPPLQTQIPGPGSSPRGAESQRMDSQARSVEAMVMTIPHIHKIKILCKIAPSLALAGLSSPAQDVRGAVVAIEGSDAQLLAEVGKFIEDYLSREPECLVRTWRGPSGTTESSKGKVDATADVEMNESASTLSTNLPTSGDPFITYLETIHYWHERSCEIKHFATADPTPALSQSPPSPPSTSATNLPPGTATTTASPAASLSTSSKPRIPVALLPSGFSLTISDTFASSIPINDAYAPLDHWQWMATLWRGIVGPDLTVYVKATMPNDRDSVEEMNRHGNVEIRNDCAAIIVRAEAREGKAGEVKGREGKIEEKILRRLGFEVLEFVRGGFGAVSGGFRTS